MEPLELTDEMLDRILTMVADRLYADVKPAVAKRQRSRADVKRREDAAGNVVRLAEWSGRARRAAVAEVAQTA